MRMLPLTLAATVVAGTAVGAAAYQVSTSSVSTGPQPAVVATQDAAPAADPRPPATAVDPCALEVVDPTCTVVVTLPPLPAQGSAVEVGSATLPSPEGSLRPQASRSGRDSADDSAAEDSGQHRHRGRGSDDSDDDDDRDDDDRDDDDRDDDDRHDDDDRDDDRSDDD